MKHKKLVRAVIAASCLGLITAACSSGDKASDGDDLKGQKLVFVNWGGAAVDAAEKGWLEPFSEQTGVSFATDSPTDNAKIKAMVESGKVTWDVVDNDPAVGASECGTLFEKRPADLDMSEIDPQYVTDDCGVPIIIQSVGLVYNKEKFGDNPPTSTTDFMDTKKFPGKRIFWNYPTGTVEPLLAADGAAPDEIFPIDWKRVEGVFDKLGDDLELKDSLAQTAESVESGDFAMCMCYLGRYASAPDAVRENLGVVWDRNYSAWDLAYVVKGSKNKDAAMEFLQFLATKEGQAGFSKYLAYSPATVGGLAESGVEVSDAFKEWMPDFNQDKIEQRYKYDIDFWSKNIDDTLQEWTRITSGG